MITIFESYSNLDFSFHEMKDQSLDKNSSVSV